VAHVATRAAGLAEFAATLLWDRPEDAPPGPTPLGLLGTVRCSVVETDDPARARREILGQVLALTGRELGLALETVLRSLTDAAALSGALLEARVVRVAQPKAIPRRTVESVALDLWRAGFAVRFGPSWTPAPDGGAVVGFGGAEEELRGLFGGHRPWEIP
jgi:hypothetical protein